MDNFHNTIKILNEIKSCGKNIHVIIGSSFSNELIKEIYALSKSYSNIRIYKNASVSNLMNKCDIAISACGSTLYELCAMTVPTIGIILAPNQEYVAKKMKQNSLIIGGLRIHEIKNTNLIKLLNSFINNKKLRDCIINNQYNLVNVNGVKILVNEIKNTYFSN